MKTDELKRQIEKLEGRTKELRDERMLLLNEEESVTLLASHGKSLDWRSDNEVVEIGGVLIPDKQAALKLLSDLQDLIKARVWDGS